MTETVSLKAEGEGRFRVDGVLSFTTVPQLRRSGFTAFAGAGALEVDLAGVSRSDSAGVSLLVDWMRYAQERGMTISFVNMPPQMLAIARVSSLDEVLPLARR